MRVFLLITKDRVVSLSFLSLVGVGVAVLQNIEYLWKIGLNLPSASFFQIKFNKRVSKIYSEN